MKRTITALIFMVAVANTAFAVPYTFTKIIDDSGEFTNLAPGTINNQGTVAFGARLTSGGKGIFTGNGGAITTIADDVSGPIFTYFTQGVQINDSGTVVFRADLDSGVAGIFTGSGGPLTSIADNSGPFEALGPSDINNNGTVLLSVRFDIGGTGVFTSTGGALNPVATSGPSSLVKADGIGDDGTVVFWKETEAGGVVLEEL